MASKTPYKMAARKSYQFFKMNQQQKQVLKGALQRQQRVAALGEATGEEHEELLRTLVDCGLDDQCLQLLHLVPAIQVAWADKEIQPREERLLRELAAARGIEPGSLAEEKFDLWLKRPPADAIFDACDQVAHTMIEHLPDDDRERAVADLENAIHAVAEAAGGLFGFFGAVSAEERALIRRFTELFEDGAGEDEDDG